MKIIWLAAAVVFGSSVAVAAFGADDDPAAWVGEWELTETANYSSCSDVDVGDVHVSQLTVSTTKGRIIGVQALGTATIPFSGAQGAKGLLLDTPAQQPNHVAVELGTKGSGRRIVSRVVTIKPTGVLGNNSYASCAIVYDVKAVRR